MSLSTGVTPTTEPSSTGGSCAAHPARSRTDGLRGAGLLPSSGAAFRESIAADAWIGWRLQPHPDRYIATHFAFDPCLGAVVAAAFLVALYVGGATGLPIIGHGVGELAAVTFLSVSLLVAGVRATPGCEVMAIPGLLLGKHTELACLIFYLLARLERRL